jgi:hypothetical protein
MDVKVLQGALPEVLVGKNFHDRGAGGPGGTRGGLGIRSGGILGEENSGPEEKGEYQKAALLRS